jgi:hypothetical protein
MNKGHSITETAIMASVLIILFAVFLIGLDKALDAQEQIECYKLQANAEQYKNFLYSPTNIGGFYITSLEKEMCDYHGIVIDAPVR